jgi:putative membrane protein
MRLAACALVLAVSAAGCGGDTLRSESQPGALMAGAPPVPGDVRNREVYEVPQDALRAGRGRIEAAAPAVPAPGVAGLPEALADGQILSITHAVVMNDQDQARLAGQRASDVRVRELASEIEEETGRAQEDEALVVREGRVAFFPSVEADRLAAEGRRTYDRLASTQGASFDRAYLDAQADASRQLLELIDRRMLPNASDGTVQAMVLALRPEVERRRQRARALELKLEK